MTGVFSEEKLAQQLKALNASQQCIQALSMWLIHHRKFCKQVAKVWYKEYRDAPPNHKLSFLYLANDIIQRSKHKGDEYRNVFAVVLPSAMKHAAKTLDKDTVEAIKRLMKIWKERVIYEAPFVVQLMHVLNKYTGGPGAGAGGSNTSKQHNSNTGSSSTTSSLGVSSLQKESSSASPSVDYIPSATNVGKSDGSVSSTKSKQSPVKAAGVLPAKERKRATVESSVVTEVPIKSIKVDEISNLKEELNVQFAKERLQPPDLGEMLKHLQALQTPASSDAKTRQEIHEFPSAYGNIKAAMPLMSDRVSCEKLLEGLRDANAVLAHYVERLDDEMKERKTLGVMLKSYSLHHDDAVKEAKKKIGFYNSKLEKLHEARQHLNNHLAKLPDLSMLPDPSAGLPPLPSIGDLFS